MNMWNQDWQILIREALFREVCKQRLEWGGWLSKDPRSEGCGQRPRAGEELGRFKGWKKAGDARVHGDAGKREVREFEKGFVLKAFAYHAEDWSVLSPLPPCAHMQWSCSDHSTSLTPFRSTLVFFTILTAILILRQVHTQCLLMDHWPPWLAFLQLSSKMLRAWEL